MGKYRFDWDDDKEALNIEKHGVSFAAAQRAFDDPYCVISRDMEHERGEKRFFCFGRVDDRIMTVRFSFRRKTVRIFGAGFWRQGRKHYEQKTRIH